MLTVLCPYERHPSHQCDKCNTGMKPGNEKEKMWILTNAIDPIFLRVTDDEGEKQTDNQYPVLKTLDSSLNESG